MLRIVAVICLAVGTAGAFQRDVPDGMCFKCEVNCMKDCIAKFDAEVIKDDTFLQVKPSPKKLNQDFAKASEQIVSKYMNRLTSESKHTCEKKHGCQIANECALSVDNELKAISQEEIREDKMKELDYAHDTHENKHKAWDDVSAKEVTISDLPKFHKAVNEHAHSQKGDVAGAALEKLDRSHANSDALGGHLRLMQSNRTNLAPTGEAPDPFPLHPVKIGVFSRGGQTLTQCMQFCFAATCGCEDSPMTGTVEKTQELTEGAIASGFHTDTPPTWRYSRATKKQCGGGVSKLIKGLWIIYHSGPGGTVEVCSDALFKLKHGASGALGLTDPKEDKKKCDCGINRLDCHEPDFGCSWNDKKSRCEFRAMHNTICYARYKTDKTLAQINSTMSF